MVPGQPDVAGDRILAHTDKSAGLGGAAALGDMGEEGADFVLRQVGVEQGMPLGSENRALQDLQ